MSAVEDFRTPSIIFFLILSKCIICVLVRNIFVFPLLFVLLDVVAWFLSSRGLFLREGKLFLKL